MPRGVRKNAAATPAAQVKAEIKALNNPVIIPKRIETAEQHVEQGNARVMRSTGDAKDSLDPLELIQVADKPLDPEHTAMLAFMNEDVRIRIGTTTDKNAEQVFEICVNGNLEFFRRGETKTVKRYIVDRMLRLKQTVYSQQEVINAEGIKDILNIPHTALKYDFSIEHDASPHSKAWMNSVLAERG